MFWSQRRLSDHNTRSSIPFSVLEALAAMEAWCALVFA